MKLIKKRIQLLLITLIIVSVSGCFKKKEQVAIDQRKINVVATIGMIADVAKNVGRDRVNVKGLMGPGVDPHLYKASAGDVKDLSMADIIFYNGLHLEAKMGDVLKKMSKRHKTIAVSKDIDRSRLLKPAEFEGLYDPHIWFDVSLWMSAVRVMRDELIALDPTHRDYYYRNADRYLKKMDQLHKHIVKEIKKIDKNKRLLVTAHDAFNYFGKAYDTVVIGLQGISTESEAGIKDVQRLANIITDHNVSAIFIESSVPKRNVEAVQQAVRAKGKIVSIGGELFSDAMGDAGTEEGTYLGMVKHNVETIVNALSK